MNRQTTKTDRPVMPDAPLSERIRLPRRPNEWLRAVVRIALVSLLLLAGTALIQTIGGGQPVSAHPLGNFTVNHFSRLTLVNREVQLHYVIDMAEIPTYQEIRIIDTNGDRIVDQQEQARYLQNKIPELSRGLRLRVGGRQLALTPGASSMEITVGQAGLRVLRIDADLTAPLPDGTSSGTLQYEDEYSGDQLGWREIVVTAGDGVAIGATDALRESVSEELRAYPPDSLSDPLAMSAVTVDYLPAATANASSSETQSDRDTAQAAAERVRASSPNDGATDRMAQFLSNDDLTPSVALLATLVAAFWGAAHALTPGHGKTVVAAYLVGTRGTARHAVFLGLTVTLTHTAGVFALGGLTLSLSRYVLPEVLYPWLNVISGLLVIAIGLTLAYRRFVAARQQQPHDHAHDHNQPHVHHDVGGDVVHTHDGHTHSHLPPGADGSAVSVRSLIALGVSGGLVPCPSALVLLLSAISLDRAGFGLVLVVAFSLGLALVLTGIGLLSVYARQIFQRFSFEPRIPSVVPVASALIVSGAGVMIVAEALRQAGVL